MLCSTRYQFSHFCWNFNSLFCLTTRRHGVNCELKGHTFETGHSAETFTCKRSRQQQQKKNVSTLRRRRLVVCFFVNRQCFSVPMCIGETTESICSGWAPESRRRVHRDRNRGKMFRNYGNHIKTRFLLRCFFFM